jgi:hypothetical protein
MTFEEAGSDDDLRAKYLADQVHEAWTAGEDLLNKARSAMSMNPRNTVRRRAERNARVALERFASALNWAEDGPSEREAHERMDAAGRWVRTTFGCLLHQEDNLYFQTCPVALGHNRIGMSVGGQAKRICSLCGLDLSECDHMRGRAYIVLGGRDDLGWCRVCTSYDGCDHQPDQTYRANLVAMVTEMTVEEVSFVGKPAHPDARFAKISMSNAELQDHLGDAWSPGIPVNCDRCLTPCGGLIRHSAMHM